MISDGVDVQTVVSTTRHVPEALKIAIAESDRRCKVRGCDRTDHLERHHTTRYADGGLTTYQVLGNACPDHHHLIHHKGYEIVVDDDGSLEPSSAIRRGGGLTPGCANLPYRG